MAWKVPAYRPVGYAWEEIDPEGFFYNPEGFVIAVIRRNFLFESPRIPFDELLHEGIVGLWEFLASDGEPLTDDEARQQGWNAVRRAIGKYVSEQKGGRQTVFSELGDEDLDPHDLLLKAVMWGEIQDLAVWKRAILKRARELTAKTTRGRAVDQGERDLVMLSLYLKGYSYARIATRCWWLTDPESARKALYRIILAIRDDLGVSPDLPIELFGGRKHAKTRLAEGENVRQDKKAYHKAYYEKHREALKEAARDRQRRIRGQM